MIRVLLQLLCGFLLTISGCYVGFLYIKSLEQGNNFLFLLLSLLLLTSGILLLLRSSRSDATIGIKKLQSSPSEQSPTPGLANKLQKDNQIMSQWAKTTEARDRLRMLEISAKAEEGT